MFMVWISKRRKITCFHRVWRIKNQNMKTKNNYLESNKRRKIIKIENIKRRKENENKTQKMMKN